MNLTQVQNTLRSSPLLRSLGEDAIASLALRARKARWERGQVVLRKGDPGNAMMIVLSGRVKVTSTADGERERILNIIEAGETFGEMSILDGEPRCADCVAIEETTALVVSKQAFSELLRTHPDLAQQVIAELCHRLRRTTDLVEDTLFVDPAVRLARRIRTLIREGQGTTDANGSSILEGLTQQDLADAVGLTRESVNRILRGWGAEGIVTLGRKSVVVVQPTTLERIALGRS